MKIQKTITGILLVAAPILFMGAFTLLQINFEYPDILRQGVYSLGVVAAGERDLFIKTGSKL